MSRSIRSAVLGGFMAAMLAGCGQPVRESRHINWSPDGTEVAVAHGQNGVFVAGKDGELRKIYQPDAGALATSPPLWAPHDRRLIFTVARPATVEEKRGRESAEADPPPDGSVVFARQNVYTCYLWSQPEGDGKREPKPLFSAPCDHVGYVAANLAVRWSPDGRRILCVRQVGKDAHALFEFDPETRATRRVLPHAAPALLFDFSPDGRYLSCVLGGPDTTDADNGIWIGPAAGGAWWHVPRSASLAPGEFGSVLERLRATRPVWSADDSRFVFVSCDLTLDRRHKLGHRLDVVSVAAGTMKTLDVSAEPYRDLAWSPDGSRLGFVRGGESGRLYVVRPEEGLGAPFVDRPVRRFAGWDRTGKRLAFVAVAAVPGHVEPAYNWLLVSAGRPRDALFVVADGEAPADVPALTGARFTFLQWSPVEPVLSLWITFTPTHRSWYSLYHDAGLRPGDPAAVFDPRTGALSWKPVNAHEQTQIGHFYLATGDPAEAWRWYQKAGVRNSAPTPDERLAAILDGRDATFFHYLCAARLGQKEEAAERLWLFDEAFRPRPNALAALRNWSGVSPHRLHHLRDRYAAEVFLSLGALEDGEAFFRAGLRDAADDDARLSGALVLSQFLLVRQRHEEYAELITDVVLPLLRCRRPAAAGEGGDALEPADYQAVLPLSCPEFVSGLPGETIERLLPRWERLLAAARRDEERLALDLVLATAYRHRGRVADADAAAERTRQNPEWQRNRAAWDAAELAKSVRALAR